MKEKIEQLISRLVKTDRKYLVIGAGVVILLAAGFFIWFGASAAPAKNAALQVTQLS